MSDAAATAAARVPKRGAMGRVGRFGGWILAAALLIVLPMAFKSGLALTMMSLMGISIVFALSYNILLGQTGMLSFGHAVYYGLGAYFTVHAINAVTNARWPIPLPLMPLVGGLAGLIFAMMFGWVSTKRSGTAFAMISLGLAELVGSSSLILRSFFGGEEGVNTNRTQLPAVLGWNFGPQIQIYYLIAFWCLIAAVAMYALTRTPLGRMCNAVRENPERVAFVGYNPQMVRYMAFCFAGLFGGIAGSLAAINFELANSALFSATQSGMVLLATFIGGAGYFFGPIVGAVLVSYLQTMLSDITDVWQLYFGILFIGTVMFAPDGIAHLIMIHGPLLRAGTIWRLIPAYILGLFVLLPLAAGLVLATEMIAHIAIKAAEGPSIALFGYTFDTGGFRAWTVALGLILAGAVGLKIAAPPISSAWDRARQTATQPDGAAA
jgi:branched-chain amino acid transport system permease protein